LNNNLLSLNEQCQENLNVNAIVSQMADVDRCGAGLCGIVPSDVAITRIAAGSARIRHIEE
jgi:hypothetical protein